MIKRLTISDAIEEFELDILYADIIESRGENLKDPSLVSDLYDLIDEHEDEYEFWPDQDGDFAESFEKNLIEAIRSIVDESEELIFVDDRYEEIDDVTGLVDDDLDDDTEALGLDFNDHDDEDSELYG